MINMAQINFLPLSTMHFPLLLKWLESPHVKAWWNDNIVWDLKKISEKYTSYVQGYKIEKGIKKPIQAFIICHDNQPIGYIQLYNAYDFFRINQSPNLPKSLAAFDMYIGEQTLLKRGVGRHALVLFLKQYADPVYEAVFTDPDTLNVAAIKTYLNAGFHKLPLQPDKAVLRMLRKRSFLPE